MNLPYARKDMKTERKGTTEPLKKKRKKRKGQMSNPGFRTKKKDLEAPTRQR